MVIAIIYMYPYITKRKPVFIDPGRFTYREDDSMRIKLKSMPVHNSIVLDEKAFCVPKDSWGYSDFGWPLKNYFTHKKCTLL